MTLYKYAFLAVVAMEKLSDNFPRSGLSERILANIY